MISGKDVYWHKNADTTGARTKEKQKRPLDFVRFFDVEGTGMAIEYANENVRIKAVDERKAFARAGLQVGDLILAINEKPANSTELVRRSLRTKVALGEAAALTVRRGAQTLNISVNFEK